jgi:hypothetical protein
MTLELSRCTVGELSERRGMCHSRRGTPSADQVSEYPGPWVLRPSGPERPILARTLHEL